MTDYPDTARPYLRDLGFLVKEMALDAKLARHASIGRDDEGVAIGRLAALRDVLSLMQQQAIAFGMELDEVSLGGIDAENDFV